MRSPRLRGSARGPGLALLAVAVLLPAHLAHADDKPSKKAGKSVARCVAFDQRDRDDEDGVDFHVSSTCEIRLSCTIKWSLTCSPGTKKQKTTWEGFSFELDNGEAADHTASASACGNAGWSLDHISWSCEPIPD
ncbi:MAG: hypothetical protein H6709_14625 [Kofleriaceae bacterium]|nr:hypothetical protein [Myxococcales bacterium]MCB9573313.1 hypothetical protein [Kofleriaceae bacterium]